MSTVFTSFPPMPFPLQLLQSSSPSQIHGVFNYCCYMLICMYNTTACYMYV